MTLHVSEDAPAGEYELMLAGWTGDQYDLKYCPYAPLSFILKVTPERPVTTTTTQIVSTTTTSTITKTSTETLTEISAITSIERVTEPSTYAWAVGVTAIAAVLATILVVKRKSNW